MVKKITDKDVKEMFDAALEGDKTVDGLLKKVPLLARGMAKNKIEETIGAIVNVINTVPEQSVDSIIAELGENTTIKGNLEQLNKYKGITGLKKNVTVADFEKALEKFLGQDVEVSQDKPTKTKVVLGGPGQHAKMQEEGKGIQI